jgi:hypothetical protein
LQSECTGGGKPATRDSVQASTTRCSKARRSGFECHRPEHLSNPYQTNNETQWIQHKQAWMKMQFNLNEVILAGCAATNDHQDYFGTNE